MSGEHDGGRRGPGELLEEWLDLADWSSAVHLGVGGLMSTVECSRVVGGGRRA
jgi:hypothetical protein